MTYLLTYLLMQKQLSVDSLNTSKII